MKHISLYMQLYLTFSPWSGCLKSRLSYVPWQTDFLRPPLGGFPQSVTVSEWLWISLVHTPVNITLQDLVNHLLHVIYIYIDIS